MSSISVSYYTFLQINMTNLYGNSSKCPKGYSGQDWDFGKFFQPQVLSCWKNCPDGKLQDKYHCYHRTCPENFQLSDSDPKFCKGIGNNFIREHAPTCDEGYTLRNGKCHRCKEGYKLRTHPTWTFCESNDEQASE